MVQLRASSGDRPNSSNGWQGVNWVPPVHGLEVEDHGGHCCGVKHLHGFPCSSQYTAAEKEQWLRDAIHRCIDQFSEFDDDEQAYSTWRGCIEVVLAEDQLNCWCRTLEEAGFKQVFSFLNHNSGNECHVFLLETNRP